MNQFRAAVEARSIDVFWRSRRRGILVTKPEKIGQALLALFTIGALDGRGILIQELKSGVGFVDIAVVRSAMMHLLELKVLRSNLVGISQLRTYMRIEGRPNGWLLLFDARPSGKRIPVPQMKSVPEGTIRIILVDIRPEAPSRAGNGGG